MNNPRSRRSSTPLSARLLLVASAVLFSTGGAAIKGTVFNGWQVAGFRSLIAAVAIWIIFPDARKWHWRSVPVAFACAATFITYVTATKLTTAANAIFLQDTAPLFVLFIAPILLKEPIRRSDLVFMVVVASGMALFFASIETAHATAPDPRRGNIVAGISAVTWAFTITGLRWIGRTETASAGPGMATLALGNLIASAAVLPFAFPVPAFGGRDIAVMLWLGLFQIALAYVCLTRGLRSVPAIEATTILLLEPALNPIWAWMVHGETPAATALAGGAIILSATLGKAWWQSRTATA